MGDRPVLGAAARQRRFQAAVAAFDRRIKTYRFVAPVSPQQVVRLIGGDPEQPGAEPPAGIELAALQVDLQEGGLKGVFRQLRVAQVSVQVAVNFPLVAADDLFEGLLLAAAGVFQQQILVAARQAGFRPAGVRELPPNPGGSCGIRTRFAGRTWYFLPCESLPAAKSRLAEPVLFDQGVIGAGPQLGGRVYQHRRRFVEEFHQSRRAAPAVGELAA